MTPASPRSADKSMRRLIITGIPATRKTTVGNYLEAEHGFRHLDFEDMPTLKHYLEAGPVGLERRIAELPQEGQDVVITWGFVPDVQLDVVIFLRSLGFEWVWFDGNRPAARALYLQAGRPEHLLDRQMDLIEKHIDPRLDALAPWIVDTFDASGGLRPTEEIATELVSGSSRASTRTRTRSRSAPL